jgi:hypothetical protein
MVPPPPVSPHRDDIAARNLACALGLPGAENLDCLRVLRTVDAWASRVGSETSRLAYIFHRDPDQFEGSFSRFRMEILTTILQRDLGVHYRQELIDMPDHEFFSRPEHLFLHGITSGVGGTCSSLPVAFVAVGRRLGYPLSLARARRHFFARWDEPGGERFNVECTSRGFKSYPDEYYLTWPHPVTLEQVERGGLLRSLETHEETACFFAQRGVCFEENGKLGQAAMAIANAVEINPENMDHQAYLSRSLLLWQDEQMRQLTQGCPHIRVFPPYHRFPRVPRDAVGDLAYLMARDILLRAAEPERVLWGPLRRDPTLRPPDIPGFVEVDFNGPPGEEIAMTFHGEAPASFTGGAARTK